MKINKSLKLLLLLVILFPVAIFAKDKSTVNLLDQLKMKNGVVFSEMCDNGQKRWEIKGSRAEAVDSKRMRIHDVTAVFTSSDGKIINMESNYCDINRETKEVKTDKYVTIFQDKNILTGIGMEIDSTKKRFLVKKDVQIITSRASVDSKLDFKVKDNAQTIITGDSLEFDTFNHVAYLRGNVKVLEGGNSLRSDNATVYFAPKDQKKTVQLEVSVGDFTEVVANGHVLIKSDQAQVTSEKAVWTHASNIIVFTGGPPMAKQGTAYIRAEKITVDANSNGVEFYPAPLLVFKVSKEEQANFDL